MAHCFNYGTNSQANLLFRRNWANLGEVEYIKLLFYHLDYFHIMGQLKTLLKDLNIITIVHLKIIHC